jgi:hypothetical protein
MGIEQDSLNPGTSSYPDDSISLFQSLARGFID